MDASFWHQRWESNQIGFHIDEANPLLVSNFNHLSLAHADRVFLPLCGKTRDIAYLLSQGLSVVGVELSQIAVEQLFSELGLQAEISEHGNLKLFHAKNIDIFVGDFFALRPSLLGPVNAVYDRAALVALPHSMRLRYTQHLQDLTHSATQLLITFEYDQAVMDGPPFSINSDLVKDYYQAKYELTHLAGIDVPGGLKGQCKAFENVWLLKPLN